MNDRIDVCIREAVERDAADICEIFKVTYGPDYTYPQFYEELNIRKMILGDDTLMLVAEDCASARVLGTASVVLEIGAYSDLVGEFGRLAVHPDARGHGIGGLLMKGRLERVRDRLHVGLVEARAIHKFSQKIARKHGFKAVGFIPNKLRFGDHREHSAPMVQYFGDALALRRNHPRVVPEVYPLATAVFSSIGLAPDAIVAEREPSYPGGAEFEIEELTSEGYSSLLRIERGRVRNREIFGPLRLHYGFFKLRASSSTYLLARDGERVAGALGYTYDEFEGNVRIFELVHLEESAIRALLVALHERCRESGVVAVEVDVAAHAPRMQRTLLEYGYVPAAYVPALAFHRTERLDVVKMWRLLGRLGETRYDLTPETAKIADIVLAGFTRRDVSPRILEAAHDISLFQGLGEEQLSRFAGEFGQRDFAVGDVVFRPGESADEMYIVLSGRVEIVMPEHDHPVGAVGQGECLGEVALLSGAPHSAEATAVRPVEAAVLRRDSLVQLERRRPDIGVVLYRNLAMGLGEKLLRTDRRPLLMPGVGNGATTTAGAYDRGKETR